MYTPAHTHTHATGLHTPFTNHSWPNFNPAEQLNGTRQAHVPSEDRQEADRPTVFGATHHCRCDVMELRVTPLPGKRFHSVGALGDPGMAFPVVFTADELPAF